MFLSANVSCRGGWDVSHGGGQDDTLSSGQFRQVEERGSVGQLREGEWKLGGGEGNRELP